MARQETLFEKQSPLKNNIPNEFFKSLPLEPGIYRFYDDKGKLLYVGKAKNLKKRLQSYLQIKDSSNSRKLWILVQKTMKIEFEILPSEAQALIRENYLLRVLKPEFNRVNTYPENYSYLVFKRLNKNKDSIRYQVLLVNEKQLDSHSSDSTWIFGAYKGRRQVTEVCELLTRLFLAIKNLTNLNYSNRFLKSNFQFPMEIEVPKIFNPPLKEFFEGSRPKLLKELCLFFAKAAPDLDCWLTLSLESDLKFLKNFYKGTALRQRRIRNRYLKNSDKKVIPALMLNDLHVMEAFGLPN